MESKDEIKKECSSMIFRLSMSRPAKDAEKKLGEHSAASKATKELWLIRESSVPGLLTVSYYSQREKGYFHQRIGFVDDRWQAGPADREEAIIFVRKAEAAFQGVLPDGSEEKLYHYLRETEFDANGQLFPKPDEASERYTAYCVGGYGSFVSDEEISEDTSPSTRLGC